MSILDTIKSIFCNKSESVENKTVAPKQTPAAKSEQKTALQSVSTPVTQMQIPEDSTLKRHFISHLKCEIESTMPTRPTESTLKRHYDSTVQAKLDNLLG